MQYTYKHQPVLCSSAWDAYKYETIKQHGENKWLVSELILSYIYLEWRHAKVTVSDDIQNVTLKHGIPLKFSLYVAPAYFSINSYKKGAIDYQPYKETKKEALE